MSRLNAIKEAVLGSKIYKSKTKTSILITIALAVTPLMIDSMLTDDSYQCPKHQSKLISSILLFGPSVCITLLGLSHSIKYIREHENRSTKKMTQRITARMFSVGILMCVTIGSTFLMSEHYVCLIGEDGVHKTRTFLVSQSREIGWIIIMGSLLITFFVALIQLMFNRPSYLERSFKLYLSLLRKESKRQLHEALAGLSKRTVQSKFEQATSNFKSIKANRDDSIEDLFEVFLREKKNILSTTKDFIPKKLTFRERLHFFSVSFDDTLDQAGLGQ